MPFIARDRQTGFLVSASQGIRKRKYFCVCPEAHAVCLRKGPKKIPHFAHIPSWEGHGGVTIPSCRAGGESECHIKAKHKLAEWRGDYRFPLRTCEVCREKVMEDCKDGSIQIEARSHDGRWRYDVLLTRQDGTRLALEVCHKHSTGDAKVLSSAVAGIPVAEFDAESILSLQRGGELDNMRDVSWICSQQCMELKESRAMEARRRAAQLEEEARAHTARLEEEKARARAARLEEEEQARARAIQNELEARARAAKLEEDKALTHWPTKLFGFVCFHEINAKKDTVVFHALKAVSAEGVSIDGMQFVLIKAQRSSISTESVHATLESFGIRPVSLNEAPALLTMENSTRSQRTKFFKHIKHGRMLYQHGTRSTYWHWTRPQHDMH